MGLLTRIANAFNFKTKALDTGGVASGGIDILRQLIGDGVENPTKFLQSFSKSVYVGACVWKIAQKTASIDFELYKIRNTQGDKVQVYDHPVLDLLYRPNPFQTKTEFFKKYVINKKLTGDAFVLKVRDGNGEVVELWNLRPDMMTVVSDPQEFVRAYEFNTGNKKYVFAPEDIIHDMNPSPLSDHNGWTPMSAAVIRVDTEIAAQNYQRYFYDNHARPDFILKTPNKIDPRTKGEIKDAWEKRHKGAKNVGKGAFLEGGLDYQQVSISQKEMDYIESMRFTRDDILVAFQVPKPIVAITDDVNLANAKTAMQIFLEETIEPEIKDICERLNHSLVETEYGPDVYVDYVNPVPEDETQKADIQDKRIKAGTLLINEAREQWGDDPIQGGDSLYMPLNMVAVGGRKPAKKTVRTDDKRKVFYGRQQARKVLQIKEQIMDELKASIYKEVRKNTKVRGKKIVVVKKKEARALIHPEVRNKYTDQILKAIDARGDQFETAVAEFAEAQKKRVLAAMSEEEASVRRKGLLDWFNLNRETKLLAEISLPFITDMVSQAATDALAIIEPDAVFSLTENIVRRIERRVQLLAESVNNTTLSGLEQTLAEGLANGEGIIELRDRVEAKYEDFPLYRNELIARTEATAATNSGHIEAYAQSETANAKEWIATRDSRTRPAHAALDGEIVALDANFSNGLQYPQEPNCRCVIAPAYVE